MSLKSYLAEKYMSGPKADAILSRTNPTKKKKRKATAASTSAGPSFIKDDDLTGWAASPHDGEDEEMEEAVVAEDRRFKKRQRTDADSGWQTVREGEGGSKTPPPAADEQPQVVETEEPFKGGLLTSAQLKKRLPKNAKQETRKSAEEDAERAAAQETVYRDSSGRKVDMAAARAEAARLKREREEKEAAKMEWGKGLVQRDDAEKRKQELEKMRGQAFARTADDVELNAELKSQERWNDPAAQFLTKKKSKGPRKPEYTGPPPPPNRFGIRPGYRWDGVDRGNGFEKKYFQKQNDRRRRGAESYEYSVDDM